MALAVAIGALVFLLTKGPPDEPLKDQALAEPPPMVEQALPEPTPPPQAESPAPDAAPAAPTEIGEREPVATPAPSVLRGQVLDAGGSPVEGAIVTWTAWDPGFRSFGTSSVEIPPERILAARLLTKTGPAGLYSFDSAPALAADEISFVHITHPGYTSASVDLGPGEADPSTRVESVLTASTPMRVTVRKGDQPAVDATVFQQASFPRGSNAPYALGVESPRGPLLFLRVYEANEIGSRIVAGSEYPQRIWAESTGLRSRDWIGEAQSNVELELLPCFQLSGSVLMPDPMPERWNPEQFGTATIRVQRVRGTLTEDVAFLAVDLDGHFESSGIPLLEADSYRISMAGSLFVPVDRTIPLPAAGDSVWLELQAEVGYSLWFYAKDSSGSPIPHAEIIGSWQVDEQHYEARFPGRGDGYVLVSGLPAGIWNGVMGADGYAPTDLGLYVLPDPRPLAWPYTLSRGATITGRCLMGIDPQEDFELLYWVPGSMKHRGRQQVLGSKDGSFTVKDVTGTQISICAIGPNFERSASQTIQLSTTSENKVTLVLEEAGEMRGRLIDAATGLGIEDSRAEVYSTQVVYEMDPIGDAVQVTGDGQFAVRRLALGANVVCFRAPGYSSRELKVWFDGNDVDLGDIELTGLHPLTAHLSLPEGEDPTQWLLIADGITALPPTRFNGQGELIIEQCHAGAYIFSLRGVGSEIDAGEVLVSQTVWLKEGEPWHLEFDLGSGPSLTVTTSGEAIGDTYLWARIEQHTGKQKILTLRSQALENGQTRFFGLSPGVASILVSGDWGVDLSGFELIEVTEDSPAELVLDVPLRRGNTRVRIVDSDGAPLSSVALRLSSSLWPGISLGGATSDSQGMCTFLALYPDVDRAFLASTAGGVQDNVPFELPGNPEEIVELVFETDAGLELHITDGGVPQPLTTARLRSFDGSTAILPGSSPDEAGLLLLENLGAGKYTLSVSGIGYWPVSMPVEATKGNAPYDVDIRRTGGLALEFLQLNGTPVVGAQISLEFVPYGETVAHWISISKLHVAPSALVTDSDGELTLKGIPHGVYRWSHALHQGEVQVIPGEQTSHEVRLP